MLNRRDTMRLGLGALAGVAGKAGVAVAGAAGITEAARVGSDVNAPVDSLQVTCDKKGRGRVVIGYADGTRTRLVKTGGKYVRKPDGRSPVVVARALLADERKYAKGVANCGDKVFINGIEADMYGKHRVVASVLSIASNVRGCFHETENFAIAVREPVADDVDGITRLMVERRSRNILRCIAANPGKRVVYWCNWLPTANFASDDKGVRCMFMDEMGCAAVWDDRDLPSIHGNVTILDVTDDTYYQDLGLDLDAFPRRRPGGQHLPLPWSDLLAQASRG